MERNEILDAMGEVKLCGIRASFDEKADEPTRLTQSRKARTEALTHTSPID